MAARGDSFASADAAAGVWAAPPPAGARPAAREAGSRTLWWVLAMVSAVIALVGVMSVLHTA